MNRLYGILPWGVIALGALHMAATLRFFDRLSSSALWFFNGGIVLVFGGVLNLINRRYGTDAVGVRRFCQAVNTVTLAFTTISGLVDDASIASLFVVLGLMGTVTVLSFLRPALQSSAV